MNFLAQHYFRAMARAAVFALFALVAGQSMADTYNIMLKDEGGAWLQCATGGFGFNKTTAGSFAVTGLSLNLPDGCAGVSGAQTFDKDSSVAVQVRHSFLSKPGTGCTPPNFNDPGCQIEQLDQGVNVEGLGGFTGSNGNISTHLSNQYPRYRLTFSYADTPTSRTWNLDYLEMVERVEQVTPVSNGTYHARNTAAVPEPETLLLLLAGLGGLLLTRRLAR